MKLFAFVDVHGSTKGFKEISKKVKKDKPDFLVCAGDFTIFGHDTRKIMLSFSKIDHKLFLIHGNHEEEDIVREVASKHKKIEFLHKKVILYKDVVLIGFGGGGFSHRDVEFEVWAKSKKHELKKYKNQGKKIIFVTHAPPYKTALDLIWEERCGNKSYTKFIKQYNVDVAISGHIHENQGKEDKIKNSRLYNPGAKGKLITI